MKMYYAVGPWRSHDNKSHFARSWLANSTHAIIGTE